MMQMLYNSENFAVVRFEMPEPGVFLPADSTEPSAAPSQDGYEIVDKLMGKGLFLQGAMAQSFKEAVQVLIQNNPTEDEVDGYIRRFASLMQQPVVLH
jgi:Protein of unknown function (DUF3567)